MFKDEKRKTPSPCLLLLLTEFSFSKQQKKIGPGGKGARFTKKDKGQTKRGGAPLEKARGNMNGWLQGAEVSRRLS